MDSKLFYRYLDQFELHVLFFSKRCFWGIDNFRQWLWHFGLPEIHDQYFFQNARPNFIIVATKNFQSYKMKYSVSLWVENYRSFCVYSTYQDLSALRFSVHNNRTNENTIFRCIKWYHIFFMLTKSSHTWIQSVMITIVRLGFHKRRILSFDVCFIIGLHSSWTWYTQKKFQPWLLNNVWRIKHCSALTSLIFFFLIWRSRTWTFFSFLFHVWDSCDDIYSFFYIVLCDSIKKPASFCHKI